MITLKDKNLNKAMSLAKMIDKLFVGLFKVLFVLTLISVSLWFFFVEEQIGKHVVLFLTSESLGIMSIVVAIGLLAYKFIDHMILLEFFIRVSKNIFIWWFGLSIVFLLLLPVFMGKEVLIFDFWTSLLSQESRFELGVMLFGTMVLTVRQMDGSDELERFIDEPYEESIQYLMDAGVIRDGTGEYKYHNNY